MSKYSKNLIKKKEIVVFNKIDMLDEKEIARKIYDFRKKIKKKIYTISTLRQKGLNTLKRTLINYGH